MTHKSTICPACSMDSLKKWAEAGMAEVICRKTTASFSGILSDIENEQLVRKYSGPQFPDNILRRLNQIPQRTEDGLLVFPLRCTSNISIVLVYTIFATSNISFASVSAGNPEGSNPNPLGYLVSI